MAVVVSDLTPANGAVNVWANAPVTCTLTEAIDLDESLAEIEVNGVTCTAANGRLSVTCATAVVLGVVEDDLTTLYLSTSPRWYDGQELQVSVSVVYDSVEYATATFNVLPPEEFGLGDVEFEAWATNPLDTVGGTGDAYWEAILQYYGATGDAQFLVDEVGRGPAADVNWICGQRYLDYHVASGLVGELALLRWTASGLVEGYRLDRYQSSGVVQGWRIDRLEGHGIIGVTFVYREECSAIVGVETLGAIAASGVVYGVNRNNVLEVHVMDPSTYARLVAAGITWT